MDPEITTLRLSKISWAPILQVVILLIGSFLSLVTAYANGSVSIYVPFLSETGAYSPEMCIFSFALILGSVAGSIVVCYRNLVMRHLLADRPQRLKKLNTIGTVCGLISMLTLAGVAALPMSTVYWAHLVAAGTHFFFALVFIVVQTFIQHYVPGSSIKMRNFRIFLCVFLLIVTVLLVIFFPVSLHKWKKVNDHPQALKTPEDQVFGLVLSASLFEWILYAVFLTFILTLFYEFRNFHLSIKVIPASEKDET